VCAGAKKETSVNPPMGLGNHLKSLQHGIPDAGIAKSQIRNLSGAIIAVFETILNRVQDDCTH
jgi:hypothetical protein